MLEKYKNFKPTEEQVADAERALQLYKVKCLLEQLPAEKVKEILQELRDLVGKYEGCSNG